MKIVFAGYIRSAGFNHPQDWIKRIGAYLGVLSALGKHHEVHSIEQICYAGELQQDHVQYHFPDFGTRKTYCPWQLHKAIKKLSPDIVIIHGTDFPIQVIQLRWMLGRRVKIILQNHGKKMPVGFKKIIQQAADKYIDAYFFTSTALAEPWLQKKLISDRKKIKEVMVGSSVFEKMNKEKARSITKIKGDLSFVWAGNLDANKDPLTVVNAFIHFVSMHPSAKLYMIFQKDDLLAKIQSPILENNMQHAIMLIGTVDHSLMEQWFSSADFFISGSRFEVYGAAVVEAMSCGCIPVLTDIPSFQKITGNECGLFYQAGNMQSLLNTLRLTIVMNREKERKKISQRFEKCLSFDAIAQHIQEIAATL